MKLAATAAKSAVSLGLGLALAVSGATDSEGANPGGAGVDGDDHRHGCAAYGKVTA